MGILDGDDPQPLPGCLKMLGLKLTLAALVLVTLVTVLLLTEAYLHA